MPRRWSDEEAWSKQLMWRESHGLFGDGVGFQKLVIVDVNFLLCALVVYIHILTSWLLNTAAAAAAKLLQSCLTLGDPMDGSPPGSPSLGFSRQEHWSGLPFPSPMHESEKWKGIRSVVSDSYQPHGLQLTRLLRPWDFPGKSIGVGCHCLLWSIHLNPYF